MKKVLQEHERRIGTSTSTAKDVTIGGETVSLNDPQTEQQIEDTILGSQTNGVPRGKEALQARKLGETWAMELVKNAINDQLAGGDLGMETPADDEPSRAARDLWSMLRDVLDGPHLQDDDWGDIVSAAVSDMVDIGHGYYEPIPTADGSLPVAALKPVDALTVQHNIERSGQFGEPAYYQAPLRSISGGVSSLGGSPTSLQRDELVTMRYPGSNRSNRIYPRAPGMQVQQALEHLTHSTTHSQRYYNDNEMPAGFLQLMQAGDQDLEKIKEKIKNAASDPRSLEVIGGDGPANWIEVGGSALNLDVIGEQQWFLQLVLAAFGLNKQEIGLVDDVNRAEGDNQLSIVHKRVTEPLIDTITGAVTTQVFPKFESYQALPADQRFSLRLRHSDPRQERAREKHLRQRYEAGAITYDEYRQQLGEDPGDTVVEIAGVEVDYGEHPRFVVEQLIRDARGGQDVDDSEGEDTGDDGQPLT